MGFVGDIVGGAVGAVSGVFGGGSVGGEAQTTATTVDWGVSPGDVVALLPINNGQQFVMLGKLVYLGTVAASQVAVTSDTAAAEVNTT